MAIGIVTPPGYNGEAGGCLQNKTLPDRDALVLPADRNVFIGALFVNLTYYAGAWYNCCDGKTNLALGCYPWCEIPERFVSGKKGKTDIENAMADCLLLRQDGERLLEAYYRTYLKHNDTCATSQAFFSGPSLMHLLVAGLAAMYFLQ